MNKLAKAGYILFCAAFAAVSLIPSAGMFTGNKSEKTAEGTESGGFPALFDESGKLNKEWNTQTDSYISENFAYRDKLISANTYVMDKLAGVSASDQIVTGKDGWLYYSQTTDDFINDPDVTDKGIQNIVHNLEIMNRYISENGGKLLVTVAPNKNEIYPEYMPSYYISSDTASNYDRLAEALAGSEVQFFDMKDFLIRSKIETGIQLYHKKDTHWNNTGALLASDALMSALGKEHNDFSDASYVTEKSWSGDLDRMLWPGKDLKDYQNIYDIDFGYSYKGSYRSADDLIINTVNDNAEDSILVFRDSFGAAVIPFISENFENATYLRARPNQLYYMENNKYDYVIIEIVERNICWLQQEAPVHSAPVINETPSAEKECSGRHNISFDNKKYVHIYGSVDVPESEQSPVYYVTLEDTEGNRISYEAYSCYEAKLLEEDEIKDNGYSVYIPSDSLCGVYNVTVTAKLPDCAYETLAGSFSYGMD